MQPAPAVTARVQSEGPVERLFQRGHDPFTIVIFGGTGDLAARKLLPALFNLMVEEALPEKFSVLGVARGQIDDNAFRAHARQAIDTFSRLTPVREENWQRFAPHLHYQAGDLHDPALYQALGSWLQHFEQMDGTGHNRLYYLALAPGNSPDVVKALGATGLAREDPPRTWARVIMEKPFGHDLASARDLNQQVNTTFAEDQVYRIDHYLGKETVQNILALRLANGIFEPVWNRRYVDYVQITVAETVGVEHRGAYYEQAGALRDIVQNHMLQLLSLTAMEPPISFAADAVHNEKVKVLQATMLPHDVPIQRATVRGQYGPGVVDGQNVPGYCQEQGVAPNSSVETYAALELHVDTWRWSGVPFYLRTGKRLARRVSEIVIQFKCPPLTLFHAVGEHDVESNVLVLRIQPDEGIGLHFQAKTPGGSMRVTPVVMDFSYTQAFSIASPEAYERLIFDAIVGDKTLFARRDAVEASWALIQPVLDTWGNSGVDGVHTYPSGTWGPSDADALPAHHGFTWRVPDNGARATK